MSSPPEDMPNYDYHESGTAQFRVIARGRRTSSQAPSDGSLAQPGWVLEAELTPEVPNVSSFGSDITVDYGFCLFPEFALMNDGKLLLRFYSNLIHYLNENEQLFGNSREDILVVRLNEGLTWSLRVMIRRERESGIFETTIASPAMYRELTPAAIQDLEGVATAVRIRNALVARTLPTWIREQWSRAEIAMVVFCIVVCLYAVISPYARHVLIGDL